MTKKAQVKKSTGRRSIKRSKRQVKQRRSTRRSTPRAKPRSRTSHYRNVRGGGKGLAAVGVGTVGTGIGSTAAYLYLRNQREEQIIQAIKKFKEKYETSASYDTIKQILEDGYGFNKIVEYKDRIESFLDLKYTDNNHISIVSDLLRVNFKFDGVENLFNQTKDIVTMLIALFIKDCGFATALLILSKNRTDVTEIEVEFLRKNLNIVAWYVRDNSPNTPEEGISRKQKFINKYTGLYKKPQFMGYLVRLHQENQESLAHIEGGYLFDSINKVPAIKNLQCIITPGAYDTFLGSYDTVSKVVPLNGNSGAGPVLGQHPMLSI